MKKIIAVILLVLVVSVSYSQTYKEMIETGGFTVEQIQDKARVHFDSVGTERGKGYKPYKRWEYKALRNATEDGYLRSSDFYYNELERYNQEVNSLVESSIATTQGNWETLGPTYQNGTSGWNPGVGRLTSIAVETTNTNHMIVGSPTGGVWKTLDGGLTWTVLTDNLSNLSVASLAIDPTDNTNYFWGSSGGTIYSSTDSGSTWNILATIPNGTTVNKILIDSINPNKMYASLSNTGIFKSIDSGATWTKINELSNSGYDIEFKPGDTNTIYASGTSFYKSTDGGITFQTDEPIQVFDQEFVSSNVSWYTSDSNQNNTVTPKTGNGLGIFYSPNFNDDSTRLIIPNLDLSTVTNPQLSFSYTNVNWDGDVDELIVKYKTSAAGAWQTLQTYTTERTNWEDVTLSLPNPSSTYFIAFEAISQWGRGLTLDDMSVTANGAVTVFETGFEPTSPFSTGPKLMAVTADNPNILYVLEAEDSLFGNLYKSTDGGVTFTTLNHAGKNYFGYSSTASDNSGQAPRDMAIAVNPDNENEVHIAGILSWRSMDGGVNFNITSQWIPGNAANQNIGYCHADIDLMEYVNGKLYVGSDGGIFVADNPQVINSNYYRDLTNGLGIRQFYRIGISQSNTEVITGGSQDNGTSVYDNAGVWKDWLGADGMESFVDKNNSNILYGTSQFGTLYKSTNQGNSRFGLPSPDNKSGNWVTPFEQDPIVQNTIYSGYDQVYKSTNGGNSWTAISQVLVPQTGPRPNNLNHLKIAPSNNNVMYASVRNNLFKTTNGGATNWTSLTGFTGSINSIAIHPTDENKIAIATTGNDKVFVSNDGGTTWTSYLNNLPDFSALALVWQNNPDNGLYLGMNYGVYYIDDTFTDWQNFNNNLPNVEISELEINTVNGKIYAGTFGRGLWKSDLFDASALSVDENVYFNDLSVFPNPATTDINVNWNKNSDVTIRIYNTIGKLMLYEKDITINKNYKIDVSKYQSGVYFMSINDNNAQITKKITIK